MLASKYILKIKNGRYFKKNEAVDDDKYHGLMKHEFLLRCQ